LKDGPKPIESPNPKSCGKDRLQVQDTKPEGKNSIGGYRFQKGGSRKGSYSSACRLKRIDGIPKPMKPMVKSYMAKVKLSTLKQKKHAFSFILA
jgi:hypothetical protein